MIGLPATIACADGDPRPRRNQGEGALAREESSDCDVTATLLGFVGAAALQRAMRRLSSAGGEWGGADDARGVAVSDWRSAAGHCRPRPALYLSRQRHRRHHPVVVRE